MREKILNAIAEEVEIYEKMLKLVETQIMDKDYAKTACIEGLANVIMEIIEENA